MKTIKLYDSDAYLKEFRANVLSCEKLKSGYRTVLDKTAFFPESGGQYGDQGFIGDIRITDTQIENGIIYHYSEEPIEIKTDITARIDFDRRFSFMQNHSGEHIVSGLFHSEFGYENIGFHLSEDYVTIDINSSLDYDKIKHIKTLANNAVFKNLNVKAFFPTKEEAERINYRSKKDITSDLRLVKIEGIDICACCAPHIKKLGEIGIIKLLDFEKIKGGTRIYMKCGSFALEDYRKKYFEIKNISDLLSAKSDSADEAVMHFVKKTNELQAEYKELKKKFILLKTDSAVGRWCFLEDLDMTDLQIAADAAYKNKGSSVWFFSGKDNSFSFSVCGNEEDLCRDFKAFSENLNIRGGGRNGIRQGTVKESEEKIKNYIGRYYGLD